MQVMSAMFYFSRQGITLIRRTAFDNIGDIDILSLQAYCLQHRREQLSGSTDKRFTLSILFLSGRFADHQQTGRLLTGTEHSLAACCLQAALLTMLNQHVQLRPVAAREIGRLYCRCRCISRC